VTAPLREIRELVRYLASEERDLISKHPAHIGHSVRAVREWLEATDDWQPLGEVAARVIKTIEK
jgi:hypothetical protein